MRQRMTGPVRWRVLMVAATAGLLVLATGSPALAKGADQATITGPGLAQPIVVGGDGEPGSGENLGLLAEDSGLFAAMFGAMDGAALTSVVPAGPLGPKYELAYRVPGGNAVADTVRQDLYPSAPGGAVTYTAADQVALGGTTTGGWYRAPAGFAQLLTTLGVPGTGVPAASSAAPGASSAAAAPARGTDGWVVVAVVVLAAGVLAALAAGYLRRRSRGRTVPVPPAA